MLELHVKIMSSFLKKERKKGKQQLDLPAAKLCLSGIRLKHQ